MATKPKPLSIKERNAVAKRFRVVPRTVLRWEQAGAPLRSGDTALRDWFTNHRQHSTAGVNAQLFPQESKPGEPANYFVERGELTRLKREKAAIELKELEGKLVPVEQISRVWGLLIQAQRTLVTSTRGQLSLRIGNLTGVDPTEIEPLLAARDRHMLETLHSGEWSNLGGTFRSCLRCALRVQKQNPYTSDQTTRIQPRSHSSRPIAKQSGH